MNTGEHLEREKLKKLYELYAPSLVRYLYSLSGSQDLALDLMQDVFVRAGQFEGETVNEKSWLFRIAKNTFLNEIRTRSRKKEVPFVEEMIEDYPTRDRSHENFLRNEILESLREKGGLFYDVFLLRVDGELGCAEIARVLGISEKTIRRDLEKIASLVRKLGVVND